MITIIIAFIAYTMAGFFFCAIFDILDSESPLNNTFRFLLWPLWFIMFLIGAMTHVFFKH